MIKNERGITLVALVVTIVVLLILAGISISLVLSNNGLVTRAVNARDQHNAGAQNDFKMIEDAENSINALLQ
jgi:type II secretory pathway pseudopilin PulG